jgi:hypothetical protein
VPRINFADLINCLRLSLERWRLVRASLAFSQLCVFYRACYSAGFGATLPYDHSKVLQHFVRRRPSQATMLTLVVSGYNSERRDWIA